MSSRAGLARGYSTALVVEDDDILAQLLDILLQREGYSVSRARDGRSIRACMETETPPDLITLDWTLPDVNGAIVLDWVRSTPQWEDIPVLVVTGWAASKAELAQALTWDHVAYIGKPFGVAELSAAVRRVCRRSGASDGSVAYSHASSSIADQYSYEL